VQHVSDRANDQRGGEPPVDVASVWEAVRRQLRQSVPDSTFKMWLEPLQPAAAQDDTLYLTAPDGIRTWVERRYGRLIAKTLAEQPGSMREVCFAAPDKLPDSARLEPQGGEVNPSYTFERFVIGEGNRVAHAAALAVAEAPSEAYNPLFLHGPPGLGKTHLLVAIANYLRVNAPQLSVRYATAESFTNEFVASLRNAGAEAFKQRYRDLDVLLVDDVQFLEGKHHTEQEFFHTFNALYEAGSQLVLSADRIPGELVDLAGRLRDRFEWGLTIPVEPPNTATRLIVLRRLVREAGIEIADREALAELAARIDVNLRQLHGALTRAVAYASMMAKPLTRDLIAEVIPSQHLPERSRPQEIQLQVGRTFGVSNEEIVGPSRAASVIEARHVAVFLTRDLTDLSLPQIGRIFGGRDHSTVLSSLRRTESRIASDPSLKRKVEELRTALHKPATGTA
jgi:chromosomal replication initiator protein